MIRRASHWLSVTYALLVYAFLYAPIIVLVVYSFNRSRLNTVWTGFTFEWYGKLLQNGDILEATRTTLVVAVISTLAATALGTLVAVGMYKYHFRGKTALDGMLYIPIVIPEIVLGIAMLIFFTQVHIPLGLISLIIAHVTFCLPFVAIVVRSRLQGFDRSVEEAAMDLGANQWQTFVQVMLPLIMPGVVAGALLAFTMSVDDVIISFFVVGPSTTTLPIKVFSMVKFGVTPEINALSTIMLLVTLTIVIFAERLMKRGA
ncbi:MAG: ABC transporter permease subunit [Hydrogenibacillus sp.]|nr:ABC transporter permease subunit [Hydrogenibacillus sp.]